MSRTYHARKPGRMRARAADCSIHRDKPCPDRERELAAVLEAEAGPTVAQVARAMCPHGAEPGPCYLCRPLDEAGPSLAQVEAALSTVAAEVNPLPGCENPDPCEDSCPGWGWFNGCEVQRCDTCDRFANDDEALDHVEKCHPCALLLARWQDDEKGAPTP